MVRGSAGIIFCISRRNCCKTNKPGHTDQGCLPHWIRSGYRGVEDIRPARRFHQCEPVHLQPCYLSSDMSRDHRCHGHHHVLISESLGFVLALFKGHCATYPLSRCLPRTCAETLAVDLVVSSILGRPLQNRETTTLCSVIGRISCASMERAPQKGRNCSPPSRNGWWRNCPRAPSSRRVFGASCTAGERKGPRRSRLPMPEMYMCALDPRPSCECLGRPSSGSEHPWV